MSGPTHWIQRYIKTYRSLLIFFDRLLFCFRHERLPPAAPHRGVPDRRGEEALRGVPPNAARQHGAPRHRTDVRPADRPREMHRIRANEIALGAPERRVLQEPARGEPDPRSDAALREPRGQTGAEQESRDGEGCEVVRVYQRVRVRLRELLYGVQVAEDQRYLFQLSEDVPGESEGEVR